MTAPIHATAPGPSGPDDYMKAILCIAHWDLHYHGLRSNVLSLLATRRKLSDAQSAVLTSALDELAERAQQKSPEWPTKPTAPTVAPEAGKATVAAPGWATTAAHEISHQYWHLTADEKTPLLAAIILKHAPAANAGRTVPKEVREAATQLQPLLEALKHCDVGNHASSLRTLLSYAAKMDSQ